MELTLMLIAFVLVAALVFGLIAWGAWPELAPSQTLVSPMRASTTAQPLARADGSH